MRQLFADELAAVEQRLQVALGQVPETLRLAGEQLDARRGDHADWVGYGISTRGVDRFSSGVVRSL
jgi:hypothetical protein